MEQMDAQGPAGRAHGLLRRRLTRRGWFPRPHYLFTMVMPIWWVVKWWMGG